MVAVGLVAPNIVNAVPMPPHVFYGQVRTQDGTVLGPGHSIEARINNIHYGQSADSATGQWSMDTQTHTSVSGLTYGSTVNFQVCADNPSTTAIEGGASGQSIFFFVSGIPA